MNQQKSLSSNNNTIKLSSGTSSKSSSASMFNALGTATTTTGNSGLYINNISTSPYISNGSLCVESLYDSFDIDNAFTAVAEYLSEDELSKLIDDISAKDCGESTKISIIRSLLYKRHFSEDFLMKYIPSDGIMLYRDALMRYHSADINSGQYSQIALLLEMKKDA